MKAFDWERCDMSVAWAAFVLAIATEHLGGAVLLFVLCLLMAKAHDTGKKAKAKTD